MVASGDAGACRPRPVGSGSRCSCLRFGTGLRELGVDSRRYPVEAVVSLVLTFNEGVILERMMGVDSGHQHLLSMIDRMLVRRQRQRAKGSTR